MTQEQLRDQIAAQIRELTRQIKVETREEKANPH